MCSLLLTIIDLTLLLALAKGSPTAGDTQSAVGFRNLRTKREGASEDDKPTCGGKFMLPQMKNTTKKTKHCPSSPRYWQGGRALKGEPDCQHEVGIQLDWQQMSKRHFEKGIVKRGNYKVMVFHASPTAIAPTASEFDLQEIRVSLPGRFALNGQMTAADIAFHFRHAETAVELVIPVESGASDSTSGPRRNSTKLLHWLGLVAQNNDTEEIDCGFWRWIRGWFQCPIPEEDTLGVQDILPERTPVHHFVFQSCPEMFVLPTPVAIPLQHLQRVHGLFVKEQVSGHEIESKFVAVGSALLSQNTFTVFDAEELWNRKIEYLTKFGCASCIVVLAYLLMQCRLSSAAYDEVEAPEDGDESPDTRTYRRFKELYFNNSRCITVMIIDNLLSYVVSYALVYSATRMGLLNRRTGVPWEYHQAFALWLVGHSLHELYWFSKAGKLVSKVPRYMIVKGAIVGPLAELDYYLDMQFIAIAFQFGSTLAYWSIGVFLFSNVLMQVGVNTFWDLVSCCDAKVINGGLFKSRGFEVMHLVCHYSGVYFAGPKNDGKVFVVIYSMAKFVFEDLLQAIIQCLFVFWYGGSAIVFASVVVSLFLSFLGAVESCKYMA